MGKGSIKRNFVWIHDRSWKIPYYVNLNSNMIELKKSVSRWTRTRRKMSLVI